MRITERRYNLMLISPKYHTSLKDNSVYICSFHQYPISKLSKNSAIWRSLQAKSKRNDNINDITSFLKWMKGNKKYNLRSRSKSYERL